MRNMQLDSGTWKFKVGKSYTVIRNPDRKAHVVPNHTLAGLTAQQWEDAEKVAIKPRYIRSYIEENLIEIANGSM